MDLNKIITIVTTLFFFNTIAYAQDVNIKRNKNNIFIFTFKNNTENTVKVPKLIWRTYNKKKNKLTGAIDEYYIKVKGDTLILNLDEKTPEYFKGSINGKKDTSNPVFLDIRLKPKIINKQLIKIKKRKLKKCNYIQLIYRKINYVTSL